MTVMMVMERTRTASQNETFLKRVIATRPGTNIMTTSTTKRTMTKVKPAISAALELESMFNDAPQQ